MSSHFGFIDHRDGANIRTLPAEAKGSECLTRQPLPPGARVSVIRDRAQTSGWSYVATRVEGYLLKGYVQGLRITTQLPEPAATLYAIRPGDCLERIAAHIYRQGIAPGKDLRFYENVIHHVNAQCGRKGVRRDGGDVKLMAGERIWLVSLAFADQLQGLVPSGSITGGALARARKAARHLEDVIASVEEAPKHFRAVAGQYRDAILEHLPEIIGIVLAFIGAEFLSTLLAASPTGVGQLAAAIIQLALAVFGVQGLVEATGEALTHAKQWLVQAWQAHGNPEKIAEASKSFLRMLISIAMAALAFMGAKSNLQRGLKLAESVKITLPRVVMMETAGAGGSAVAVPIFQPGAITAAPTTLPLNPWGWGTPLMSQAAKGGSASKPPLTDRVLGDAELEKLLEKLPNWDKLKQFVGRQIPKEGTPAFDAFKKELQEAGYRLEKLSDGPQPYRLRRPNGQSLGNEYAALTVTEDGLIVLKSSKAPSRISIFTRYRKNYLDWVKQTHDEAARAAAEARISQGHPLHHLIPDAEAQTNQLVREAMKRVEGYTIDRGSNILDMPPGANPEWGYIHSGSHPSYSNLVRSMLNRELAKLIKLGPPSRWTPKAIDDAIRKVEDELRHAIESKVLEAPVIKKVYDGDVLVGQKLARVELPLSSESNTA
ncbi:hypothetical protein D7V80_14940 [Corallococcus sp. CA054B]|nr:hypothetical protein D7V80_14940 [Corallococcus sp. CA054B]